MMCNLYLVLVKEDGEWSVYSDDTDFSEATTVAHELTNEGMKAYVHSIKIEEK